MSLKMFVIRPARNMLNMLVCVSLLIGAFPPVHGGSLSYRPDPEPQSLADRALTTATDNQESVVAVREPTLEDVSVWPDAGPRQKVVASSANVLTPGQEEVHFISRVSPRLAVSTLTQLPIEPDDKPDGESAYPLTTPLRETAQSPSPQSAISLSYGQTVTGTIATPGQVVTYTFTASAGDVLLFRLRDNGALAPEVRLYAPDDTLLGSDWSYDYVEMTETLVVPGTYTILVSDHFGTGTDDYLLHLQRLNGPTDPVPIAYGQTLTGTISVGIEMDVYTFAANAGDVLLFRLHDNGALAPEVRLYASDGSLLTSDWSYDYIEINQTLSASDTYTLLVGDHFGTGTGDYSLHLQRLNGPANATPIAYGQTLTGTVALMAEMDAYTFTAGAGDVVLAGMSDNDASFDFDPEIRLYAPDGSLLTSNWSYDHVAITQTLSSPGDYTLLAGDYGGTDTGDYTLALNRPTWAQLTLGVSHTDTLIHSYDADWYWVQVEADEHLSVQVSKDTAWYGSLYIRYGALPTESDYDARSYQVQGSQAVDIPVTQAGTYYVMLRGGGPYSPGYGSYTITARLGFPWPFLPIGEPQDISVTSRTPLWFQIEVPSGTTNLFVTLQKYSSWSGELKLYNGSEVLTSVSGSADQILQLSSPATGTYLVEVSGSGSGRLTALTALPELPLGQWVVGTILRSWGSAWYQCDVPPGQDSLFIRVETIGAWSRLYIHHGTVGDPGGGGWSSSGPIILAEIPSPEPGIYYMHLTDSAWIQGDDQTRDHLIKADATPIEPSPCSEPTVTSIAPTAGGTAGPVTVIVNGQCLDPEATVCLTRQGYSDVCAATVTGDDDGRTLAATFDLSAAEPGDWTLVVTNPSSQSAAAPTPFTVESGGEAKLWVEILGRDQIRVGRAATFIVRYGNGGDLDVPYPWLAIALPWQAAYELDVQWAMIPTTQTGPVAEDTLMLTLLDLPPLPAGSTGSVSMRVTPDTSGPLMIRARITTDPDPYFESLLSLPEQVQPGVLDRGQSHTQDEWPQVDWSATPPPGYVLLWQNAPLGPNCCSFHVAKSLSDGWYIEMLHNDGGADLQVKVLDPNSPGYKGALRPPNYSEAHGEMIRNRAGDLLREYGTEEKSDWTSAICDSSLENSVLKTNCMGAFLLLNPEFIPLGLTSPDAIYDTLAEPLKWDDPLKGSPSKHRGRVEGDNGKKCSKAYEDVFKGVIKEVWGIQSVSPEDKYGPAGWDPQDTSIGELQRWIPAGRALDYRIDFWNKEDAPAATLDVVITDQLDSDLDWSTFKFTEIGFLDWQVELKPTQYFNVEVEDVQIDLSTYYTGAPVIDLIVNVEGTFDADTGQIEWKFHALDPITRQPPEDPLAGFLPPITDSGWEIGWVAFSVSPKPDLSSGTVISNQSYVKFDVDQFKPAPPEGPFTNTLDALPPTSAVQTPTGSQPCTSFLVAWTGEDDPNGSGLRSLDVYVDDLEDEDSAYLWQTGTIGVSAVFKGLPGHRYGFYTRAHDNAGNVEAAPELFSYDVEITAGTHCVWLPLILKGNP
jgi:hypothetical protein